MTCDVTRWLLSPFAQSPKRRRGRPRTTTTSREKEQNTRNTEVSLSCHQHHNRHHHRCRRRRHRCHHPHHHYSIFMVSLPLMSFLLSSLLQLYCFVLCTLCCPKGIFTMGNSVRFPQGKTAATESRNPTSSNYSVHDGVFRVSIIHRTLTWTTGSLTCVHDHVYACVHTHGGLAPPTANQHTIFDSEKLTFFSFLVLQTGFEPRSFGSRVGRSTN